MAARTTQAVHTDSIFKDGDGPELGAVRIEGCADGDVGLHVYHHADTHGNPFASVYLDPVGAVLLGERLVAAGRSELEVGE